MRNAQLQDPFFLSNPTSDHTAKSSVGWVQGLWLHPLHWGILHVVVASVALPWKASAALSSEHVLVSSSLLASYESRMSSLVSMSSFPWFFWIFLGAGDAPGQGGGHGAGVCAETSIG